MKTDQTLDLVQEILENAREIVETFESAMIAQTVADMMDRDQKVEFDVSENLYELSELFAKLDLDKKTGVA